MSSLTPEQAELSRRARWLIEHRSTEHWVSGGAGLMNHVTLQGVYIQDSADVLTVHLVTNIKNFMVEVYREVDGVMVPRRDATPEKQFAALERLRLAMVLDDIADA